MYMYINMYVLTIDLRINNKKKYTKNYKQFKNTTQPCDFYDLHLELLPFFLFLLKITFSF